MKAASIAASVALGLWAVACKRTDTTAPPVPTASSGSTAPTGAPTASAVATEAPAPGPSVMPRDKVLAVVNPMGLPEYTGKTGILEGHIYVEGDASPDRTDVDFSRCPKAKSMHGKLFRDQALGATGTRRALLDAIVGVTGYRDAYIPARSEAETIEIKDCSYSKRTVVLTLGQRLDVFNREPSLKDNFYAPDLLGQPARVLRLAAPGGDAVHLYPSSVTRDVLGDKMKHTYMTADVFVAAHSLNTVSGEGGTYRIVGVPVGKMTVTAFHPAFQSATAVRRSDSGVDGFGESVEIVAGKVTTRDIVLTYRESK